MTPLANTTFQNSARYHRLHTEYSMNYAHVLYTVQLDSIFTLPLFILDNSGGFLILFITHLTVLQMSMIIGSLRIKYLITLIPASIALNDSKEPLYLKHYLLR